MSPRLVPWCLLALLACAPQLPEISRPRKVALISFAKDARITPPTGRLNLRIPSSRSFLLSGWRLSRQSSWSGGQPAVIQFFSGRARPESLSLRCRLAHRAPAPVQLHVAINDKEVGSIHPGRWAESSLSIPAGVVHPGWNRLVLELDPPLASSRAVEWDFVDFGTASPPNLTPLRVDETTSSLVLAAGHQAEFYFDLPDQTQLTVDGLRFLGDGCGTLTALWRPLGEEAGEILNLRKQGAETVLVSDEGGPGSLILRSTTHSRDGCDGVALRNPRLEMTARAAAPAPVAPQRRASNVVFFLVDTLRADHLGAYGYSKPTSPVLDRFAEGATLFLDSQAQSSWTRASVASVFTGLLPQEHGANRDEDGLADEAMTLAEILADAGYETAGFSANGNAAQGVNFDQGFETWQHLPRARSETVVEAATSWLRSRDSQRPFLLWVHTIDPHAPYAPPPDLRDLFAPPGTDPGLGVVETFKRFQRGELEMTPAVMQQLTGLYDAEIRNNDRSFGVLLSELDTLDLAENTIVVFLSDHGEEFAEHDGWTHGKTLFAEMLETPLVIRFPDLARGRRVDSVAQQIDLLPTLLDYFGMAVPASLSGRSLLEPLERQGPATARPVFAHLDLRGRVLSSVVLDDWKFVRREDGDSTNSPLTMLYRRDRDPAEQENLSATDGATLRTLATLLEARSRHLATGLEPLFVDTAEKELRRELQALGYVN